MMLAALVAGACGRIGYDAQGGGESGEDAAELDAAELDAVDDPLRVGCQVHLAMDEAGWTGATGEVVDGCGGDDSGTATGGATTEVDPVRGTVGVFGGGTGCVRIPDRPALHPGPALTMSAWVYPTALNGTTEYGMISKRVTYGDSNEYSVFVWTGDQVWVDLDTENDRFGGGAALRNGGWRQVTVVYDGAGAAATRARVYLDGVLDHESVETSGSLTSFAADLFVGCLPLGGPAQGWVGKLDDAIVWTRALDASEVADWYQRTRR